MVWLGVALGGSVGALLRYELTQFISQRTESPFPWATFLINITGALLLAFLHPFLLNTVASAGLRLALTSGFLGAYTTFSTFTWETVVLLRDGQGERAILYVTLSVVLGLLAAWLGYSAAQWLMTRG